jgi:ribonuclease-3
MHHSFLRNSISNQSTLALFGPVRLFFKADKELSKSIKNIFGFRPGNIFLYELAFKHKSVSSESLNGLKMSNERLEYLGDAVLGAIVAEYLFKKFPYKNEGFLTEMRSKIVNRIALGKLAQKLGLDKLVIFSKESKNPFRSVNGDAFEAFIGALYLDKGYTFTRKVLIKRIIEMHVDLDSLEKNDTNYKSRLIEWAQKEKHQLEFNVVDEVGEGYHRQYVVEISVDGNLYGQGTDFSIKGAEQLASEKTMNALMKV